MVLPRHPFGGFNDAELQGISPSHQRRAFGGQPRPLRLLGGPSTLELAEPLVECRTPGLRISLKRRGEEQQRCQFCPHSRRSFVFILGARHAVAQSAELPAEVSVLRRR
jgi:hypothetical protein